MSREGVSIAARERARRLQAALGEGATRLMGCMVAVLPATPEHRVGTPPAATAAANDDSATASRAEPERTR